MSLQFAQLALGVVFLSIWLYAGHIYVGYKKQRAQDTT